MADSQLNTFLSGLSPNLRNEFFRLTSAEGKDVTSITRFISDNLKDPHLRVHTILQQADINFTPADPKEESLDESREKKERGHTPASGNLINHDKYEKEILDKAGEQQQLDAIAELDTIRNGNYANEEERKKALEGKFSDILKRNRSTEDVVREQHELIAQHLEEGGVGEATVGSDGKPTTTTAQAIRTRANDLVGERSERQRLLSEQRTKEFDKLEEAHIGDLERELRSNPNKIQTLTDSQKADLKRYRSLRSFQQKELRRANRQFDENDIWSRRFSHAHTAEEQNALLRKYLSFQQRKSRNQIWEVFDKKKEHVKGWGRVTNMFKSKKTLSVKDRRKLLKFQTRKINAQKKTQNSSRQKGGFINRFFGTDPRFSTQSSDLNRFWKNEGYGGYQGQQDSSSGGFSVFDLYHKGKNIYDQINNIRKITDLLRGAGQTSEALGTGGASTAATGGAVGGTAAGAGGGLGATAPVWVPIVVFIGLAVLLFIFVFVTNQGTTFSDQLVQLQCGDLQDIPVQDNVPQMESLFAKRFGAGDYAIITPIGDRQNLGPETITVHQEERMYNAVCVLFGHILGTPYQDPNKPSAFNTFGTMIVGTPQDRKNLLAGSFKTAFFQLIMSVDSTQDPKPCGIEFQKIQDRDGVHPQYKWFFHHPELCNNERFQFLIAQWLGHVLIIQQEHLNGVDKGIAFNNFKKHGIMAADGLLPTDSCQAGSNYGEGGFEQQAHDCFADMIAEYFTYGYELKLVPPPTPTP